MEHLLAIPYRSLHKIPWKRYGSVTSASCVPTHVPNNCTALVNTYDHTLIAYTHGKTSRYSNDCTLKISGVMPIVLLVIFKNEITATSYMGQRHPINYGGGIFFQ